ncbi:rhomboid family intramembrane serine protease [Pseudoalteromonas sp. SMS1]|uniref:rhomboid family intramembrane serine protease n=1 Tax=Pseudoalteromonas sp. SMS1 TaxID=2908894 RepID=UPI001F199668|nr:rhomboid family intramembrane serine protease [Pseudoalteromonas sp. SMS1]MCF2860081.1 rhomboid family intramembrane serine protease [Pseudoalteromonas sp. SMS1]
MKSSMLIPRNFVLLIYASVMMILVMILDLAGVPVKSFGIVPLSEVHLIGIFTAPFIHDGWSHLSGNLIGLIISGYLMSQQSCFKRATVLIVILTGMAVWLFAGGGNHIGASGVVMGYYGCLLGIAIFRRNLIGVVSFTALVVLTYYANINFFATLLDFSEQTSSEGHWFGFFSGLCVSYLFRKSP